MVRYKRRRRYYRKSTNVIRMKFQSFMDISTNSTSMQIITISAGGKEILRRLAPQFGAYKYYKIGNIAVKAVPASTLPVDPSGLSYTPGENQIDPRDQLTPGMMRITNGEDVFENIAGLTETQQRAIYNNMLLDPRWYKWMLQTGVKRHATPRYWQIGQLHQDKWPGAIMNVPGQDAVGANSTVTVATSFDSNGIEQRVNTGSDSRGFFQTGHKGVLGWLPTDGLAIDFTANQTPRETALLASPPEIEVMKIILPRAYDTRYYYRLFITETVLFKEPIVNFGIPDGVNDQGVPLYYQPLDVFHVPANPSPSKPSTIYSSDFPRPNQTGGNYGDN